IYHTGYDSFGKLSNEIGTGGDRFKYAGQAYDSVTGQYHAKARDFDAVAGRWTTVDPLGFDGGDYNLYRYVNNTPVNCIDPTGEFAWWILIGLGLAAGASGCGSASAPVPPFPTPKVTQAASAQKAAIPTLVGPPLPPPPTTFPPTGHPPITAGTAP